MSVDPFINCQRYAFRVESLPHYDVPGTDEKLRIYQESGKVDVSLNADWHKTVADCVARGARVLRLRLVSNPLSLYESYEIDTGYEAGIGGGEQIRILDRNGLPPVEDFWSFDDTVVRRMQYGPNGEFLDSEVADMTPDEVKTNRYWLEMFERGIPVDEYRSRR